MKAFNRVAAAVCGLVAVGILVLGLVPFSAPAGAGRVDCGSVFQPADWGDNEECEHENTGRGAVMILLFVLALPFALAVAVFSVVKLFRPSAR